MNLAVRIRRDLTDVPVIARDLRLVSLLHMLVHAVEQMLVTNFMEVFT